MTRAYLRKNTLTPSLPSLSQYCSNKLWCTHCFAYLLLPSPCEVNAATRSASDAPGTTTSRCSLMKFHDCSYPFRGKCENASREGVNSGSSTDSSSADVDDDAVAAVATPLGLMTSNSCFFVVDELWMAFLMGAGAGLGGTYCG